MTKFICLDEPHTAIIQLNVSDLLHTYSQISVPVYASNNVSASGFVLLGERISYRYEKRILMRLLFVEINRLNC